MPLPALQKVWTISPNNRFAFTSLNAVMASVLFSIKNFLVATMGYTVKYTCDGTTGPTSASDHTDRWTSSAACTTRFNGAGGAQSYAVLTDGNGADLLLDFNGATDDIMTFCYSPGGIYTLATPSTQKPTATDEIIVSTANSVINATTSADRVLHMWASSDKKMFRFVIYRSGSLIGAFGAEQITSVVAAPAVFSPAMYGFRHNDMRIINTPAGQPFGGSNGTPQTAGYTGAVGLLNAGVDTKVGLIGGIVTYNGTIWNSNLFSNPTTDLQNAEIIYPILKASNTAPVQGPVGVTIDWWGQISGGSAVPAVGEFFGALQFVSLGSSAIWPWDNATPFLATS